MGCRNEACGERNSIEWKKGWPLRSGNGFAILCYSCGTAYENSLFCETFHLEETGWRDCASCGKKLHCGCIVSKSLYELLDYGGVGCINCANRSRVFSNNTEVPNGVNRSIDVGGSPSTTVPNRVAVGDSIDEGRLLQLCKIMEANEPNLGPRFQRQEIMPKIGELVPDFPTVTPSSLGPLPAFHAPDSHKSLGEPSLKMTLGAPSRTSNLVLALSGGVGDVREQSNTPSPSFEQQRNRPILPKPVKSSLGTSTELSKGVLSPMRIARPPGEGRGRSQLLPRYWPRITDQELEKLSGDLNSTIVPLFEKVLSASDAGRIGRLVLPKACAEAYFPTIAQSEGLPLRIQDVKGNEWTFQFRFWPNNNSRMYVLEGVTPCIQAMQLQAGDTVTFSRINPGGKLVMGFRKSSNNGEMPEGETSTSPNGTLGEPSYSSAAENLPTGNGYPSLTQNALYSENLHLTNGDMGPQHKIEKNGFRKSEDASQQPASTSEKKKTKNIGSKSKRLLMHSEDVLELRLTWEEAQELLRPPPTVNPSVVTVEDHEFEEYDEPPVFGKRTLFVSSSPRGHEQWAQCDDCSKWRKLPADVLLPPKWTCSDNEWDSTRVSCSVPEEMSLKELENLLRATKDTKKRRISENRKPAGQRVPSGLDALARAAVLGEPSGGAAATTTRHPRHRPGCTCIVCIQPPSGKGKHKPTCTCNVCMTVKRRFKTLMLRKKKRQFERDAVDSSEPKKEDEPEMISAADVPMPTVQAADHMVEIGAGQIDLNCHPSREDMQMEVEMQELNTMNLLGEPISELNGYPNQQQPGLGPCLHRTANGDGAEELFASPAVWESDSKSNGVFVDPNLD